MANKKKNSLYVRSKKRISSFLKRRPHRSFRLTRRRDYARTLDLPGYFSFTRYVIKTIWPFRKTFLLLILFFAVTTVLLVGFASQETYTTLSETLNETGGDLFNGGFGEIGKAGLLFLTALTGGFSDNLTEIQQLYAVLIALFTWLTTVWLLRNFLAGHKVKLRDGLYSSGSPVIPTALITLLLVVQLLPISLAVIGYSAASLTGLLDKGVEAMLFWIGAGLLTVLSLYWISSTMFALIIVTIPGMYPYKAIKTAGDLVIGRRLRILFRLIWLGLITVIAWGIIIIPSILLDKLIKDMWPAASWLPIIPLELLLLGAVTIVWSSSYIYLLYRKVVDDDSSES